MSIGKVYPEKSMPKRKVYRKSLYLTEKSIPKGLYQTANFISNRKVYTKSSIPKDYI